LPTNVHQRQPNRLTLYSHVHHTSKQTAMLYINYIDNVHLSATKTQNTLLILQSAVPQWVTNFC